MSDIFKFENGDQLIDEITGFKGTVISRMQWLNGCIQYCIKPKMDATKKIMAEGEYIDEGQLKLIKPKKKITEKRRSPGGPGPDYPRK